MADQLAQAAPKSKGLSGLLESIKSMDTQTIVIIILVIIVIVYLYIQRRKQSKDQTAQTPSADKLLDKLEQSGAVTSDHPPTTEEDK